VGEISRGLLGLEQQVLDTQELTIEAVAKCDRVLLRRAMLIDPLTPDRCANSLIFKYISSLLAHLSGVPYPMSMRLP